jgi:CheY-like chemotaxis protein
MNGLFAAQSLEMAGALVDWARDGVDAVTSIEASFAGTSPSYDLVLMDIRMPRLDGLAATRRIRALEADQGRAQPLRIVALTATTMPQDRLAAEEAGIDGFLAKPYRADALVRLLPPKTEGLARAS